MASPAGIKFQPSKRTRAGPRAGGVLGYLRGVTFCLLWYFSILAGFYLLYCPLLPLLVLSPRHYRAFTEIIFGAWETYPTALMEIMMGTKIVVVGDKVDPEDRALIVMNHRTRLDWNYLWAAMFHGCHPPSHRLKFVLKSAVRHFPGPGWVMQMTCFLYIHRSWEMDQKLMNKVLDYFKDIGHTCQLLIFPEGTDLTKQSKASSDRYAAKHNLPEYERVLHPKTTGFAFLSQRLRGDGQLDAVYDLTIAYPKSVPQTEKDMLKGMFPEEVHFKIKRHAIESLPLDEVGYRQWLCQQWKDKEESLQEFYKTQSFPQDCPRIHDRPVGAKTVNALHLSFVAWTALTLFSIYALFSFWWFQMWVLATTSLFVMLSFVGDGFQHLEIALHYARKHHEKKCN
ncbi:lysocardiolipin acyltransferase 1-like isoform X2 [Cloeon dipterum]|uniref:lysocardiolipin acyltransferase 1-like isoform X2 n=1 Tax=Cloeon dipterum TaxID=197152 RepID=UPI00321FF0E6